MPAPTELSLETLRTLRRLTLEADRLLESCVADRLSLAATMERFLPSLERWLGAKGATIASPAPARSRASAWRSASTSARWPSA